MPRCKPGPPSSDQTAARMRRGSMAQRTPALSPRAPPSPVILATSLAILGTFRRGEKGLRRRSA
eukprot:4671392-Alexandrium_andersonii.AAC.1